MEKKKSNFNMMVGDIGFISTYIDSHSTYSLLVLCDTDTKIVSYEIRPVIRYRKKNYIVDIVLGSETFNDLSVDEALKEIHDRIDDTVMHNNDINYRNINWPNYDFSIRNTFYKKRFSVVNIESKFKEKETRVSIVLDSIKTDESNKMKCKVGKILMNPEANKAIELPNIDTDIREFK